MRTCTKKLDHESFFLFCKSISADATIVSDSLAAPTSALGKMSETTPAFQNTLVLK